MTDISGERCLQTIHRLDRMGVRFAATAPEQQAADWIESRFRKLGLRSVEQQHFSCLGFEYSECRLEVRVSGRGKKLDSLPAAHSPGAEGRIEAPLAVLDSIPPTGRVRKETKGRAVLTTTSALYDLAAFRRLMGAGPAAVVAVDDRLPVPWTVAVGLPRYWIGFVSCPLVNVSYLDAWSLVQEGADSVRLRVRTRRPRGTSQNVIGEIRGRTHPEEVVVVSGHHDTVINNSGADDNGSGVASVLELARFFSARKPNRTLRFISYGAEEQLSEGAWQYAQKVPDLKRIKFVLNVDAVGAWMGSTRVYRVGRRQLTSLIHRVSAETGFEVKVISKPSPFSDHFPLNVRGVPGVWYYRPTTAAEARHFHHSAEENPSVVSPQVMERTVSHQAALLERIVQPDELPFPPGLPNSQKHDLRRLARHWLGVK